MADLARITLADIGLVGYHGYHAAEKELGQRFEVDPSALGCEIAYAAQLIYADGIELDRGDIAVPIGLHCRLCERTECSQRAFPPAQPRLVVDENVRGAAAYGFDAG